MEKKSDWKRDFLQIMKILQANGVDVTSIPTRKTGTAKKREYIVLEDIRQEEIDIESIIRDNQLDGNYKIGQKLNYFRLAYKGTRKVQMSDEERIIAEELGIVEKMPIGRQPPLFKGRKISQFHVDIVESNKDRILAGKLTIDEIMALINEEASKIDETQIKDKGTIKRIIDIVLEDKPEEIERYQNKNKRKSDSEYVSKIIDHYLPLFLEGKITLDIIEKELQTSRKVFERIIVEHYKDSGNSEGLELYEKIKINNRGTSIEKRNNAKQMRDEVAGYEVVSNAEFLLLSEVEQDNQIIIKIRQGKLKEEKSKENSDTRVITKETTMAVIERIKQYFRNKNDYENGIENFSEQDIRYMIFRFPTLISRSNETLDEKFEILTSYDEIDEQTAYGMVKTFPAISGYSVDRMKAQLDLLQKENLIDAIISKPMRMMQSVNLMYALIQYAKERHHISDLSDVNRSNIFMSNSVIKRLYGETYEELKKRFPYNARVDDMTYMVSGEDIGRATYKDVSVTQSAKASRVVDEMLRETKEVENVD